METPVTLYTGANVRTRETLTATTLPDLVARLRTDEALRADTEALRNLLRLDPGAYKQQKTRLPYFCCAAFRDNRRRIENFVAAAAMPFDVDWGATDQRAREELRRATYADDHTALAYRSSSGTNWRVVVPLARPITDANVYKAVYLRLVSRYKERYPGLRGLDERTHDCSRANFLAYDPEAYLNRSAAAVDWGPWLRDLPAATWGTDARRVSEPTLTPTDSAEPPPPADIPYKDIRSVLRARPRGNVYRQVGKGRPLVPTEILELIPQWSLALTEAGFAAVSEKPISHGLKVMVRRGRLNGDVTIYYGKKGYKFVVGNQGGADGMTGQAAAALLEDVVYSAEVAPLAAASPEELAGRSFMAPSGKTAPAPAAPSSTAPPAPTAGAPPAEEPPRPAPPSLTRATRPELGADGAPPTGKRPKPGPVIPGWPGGVSPVDPATYEDDGEEIPW